MKVAAALGTFLLVCVLFLACREERTLGDQMASVVKRCASQAEAWQEAQKYSQEHGGIIFAVAGTGSMRPWLDAAPKGADPYTTIVGYAVSDMMTPFSGVRAGDPCMYMSPWAKNPVLHQAVEKEGDGWVMGGSANATYDKKGLMTSENFLCRIQRITAFTP